MQAHVVGKWLTFFLPKRFIKQISINHRESKAPYHNSPFHTSLKIKQNTSNFLYVGVYEVFLTFKKKRF